MSPYEARSFCCLVYYIYSMRMHTLAKFTCGLDIDHDIHSRNGAIMPLELPIVNCSPVAVVLFPYLGLLVGNLGTLRSQYCCKGEKWLRKYIPSQRNTGNDIESTSYQEASKIAHTVACVRDQDPIPNHRDGTEQHTKKTPFLLRIRNACDC